MKFLVPFCALLLLGCTPSESEVADARAREILAAYDPKRPDPASYREIKEMGPLASDALVDEMRKNPESDMPKFLLADIAEQVDFGPLLSDPDPRVRANALFALGLVEDKYAREILRLMDDTDPQVKLAAYNRGGSATNEHFYQKYADGLSSPNVEIRLICAYKLMIVDDERGLLILVKNLHHDDPKIVFMAGEFIALQGTRESVRVLKNFRKEAPEPMHKEVDRIIETAESQYRWFLKNPRHNR